MDTLPALPQPARPGTDVPRPKGDLLARLLGARRFVRRGDAARDRRDWPGARDAYRRALALSPGRAAIWIQYGHALKEDGDLQGAEAAYRRGLALGAPAADAHLQLGHALKLQDRLPEAMEAYARAATLEPSFAAARREAVALRTALAARGVRGNASARAETWIPGGGASAADVVAVFEAVLGRPPTGEADVAHHLGLGFRDRVELGEYLLATGEFRDRFDRLEAEGRTASSRRGGAGRVRPVTIFLGDRVLTETHRGFRIYLPPNDLDLAPHILLTGTWETHIEALLDRVLRPGGRAADVGANVGYHTLGMAAAVGPSGHIHAFEASPLLQELLDATVFVNGLAPRVRLHRAAAMDRAGSVVLAAQPNHLGSGNAAPPGEGDGPYDATYSQRVTVPAVSLDEALPADLPLDLIHMDIEGAEPLALRGAEAVIRRSVDLRIVAEWSVAMMGARCDVVGFVAWLRGFGFHFWRIGPNARLEPVAPDALPALPHSDLLISRTDPD